MSVRVNLLRPDEIQQSASIGRESLARIGTIAGIGAAALGLLWMGFSFYQTRTSQKQMAAEWAALEPDYLDAKALTDRQAINLKLKNELDTWTASRVDWEGPMLAVQQILPENLQVTHLSIQGNVAISSKEPTTPEKPGTPARTYKVRMEGRAVGSLSDQDVIAFVESVRNSSQFQPWVSSVKLQGMQRAAAQPGKPDEEARLFRIDATSKERMMK